MKKQLSFRHRLVCALPLVLTLWLIEQGCYKQFINNTCVEQDVNFLNNLEKGKLSLHGVVLSAFVWDNTPEGGTYWYRRNMYLRHYLRNL